MAKPCVRVYNGDGAGSRSVLSTIEALHQVLKPDVEVGLDIISSLYISAGLLVIVALKCIAMSVETTGSRLPGLSSLDS